MQGHREVVVMVTIHYLIVRKWLNGAGVGI